MDNVKSVGLELKIWVVGSFLSFDLHVDIGAALPCYDVIFTHCACVNREFSIVRTD